MISTENRKLKTENPLTWALIILLIAAGLGLAVHWPMVRQGWKGELAGQLQQWHREQRQLRFEGIRTVNLQQAYEWHSQGKTLFIDARKPEEFKELHIAGAVNITPEMAENQVPDSLRRTPLQQPIIVYCGHEECDLGLRVAELLQAQGFSRIMAFMGGFRVWDEAGYPVDISK
jgi:rhodanese-related sulfurtransferase